MIDPGWAGAPWALGALLVALLGLFAVRAVRKDRREYRRFTRYRSTRRRTRMMRKWLLDSLVTFGATSVISLALVSAYIPLMLDDIDAIGWVSSSRTWWESLGVGADIAVAAVAIALLVGGTLAIYAARSMDEVPTIGNIHALLPRNRAELPWGFALSINAGVVEELMFRLAMPVIIFAVTGEAVIAVLSSIVIFGLLHAYQGAAGVVVSSVIGAVLTVLYVATGSILVPIVVHALIDLRSLVVIPVIVYRVHRVPGVMPTLDRPRLS